MTNQRAHNPRTLLLVGALIDSIPAPTA
jgi:hypothetical protein